MLTGSNNRSTMPELTVAMPAYNTAAYIEEAIASVLRQQGVDFELIVVDDGSQDNTVEIVRRFDDWRLWLFQNDRRRGIGFCHNLIVKHSRAPFIVHVDSDDMICKPDAFAKLLRKIRTSESIGQVHCHHFWTDAKGRIPWDEFRMVRRHVLETRKPNMDYRWHLLVRGSVMNSLRMYRKAVLESVGPFNEQLPYGEDYEMALRIVDKHEIALVPEFLYAARKHGRNTSHPRRFGGLTSWWQRLTLCNQLLKSGAVQFPRLPAYEKNRLMALGLVRVLRLNRRVRIPRRFRVRLGQVLREARTCISAKTYRFLVRYLGWWPIGIWPHRTKQRAVRADRLALYPARFSALSQMSVQRYAEALQKAGLAVLLVAESAAGTSQLGASAIALLHEAGYLHPLDPDRYRHYRHHFQRKHPLRFLNLLLYGVFHSHGYEKNFREALVVFQRAVCLAGVLKDAGITHVHASSSDHCTFIALMATRLLGITYSVQARANDMGREQEKHAAGEEFSYASFILTNSQSHNTSIRSILGERKPVPVHTIYNGLDLEQFRPKPRLTEHRKELAILSVARLVEENGLVVLLKSCKLLRESGCLFHCRIIGGPELPTYMDYYLTLKKLHKALALEGSVSFLGPLPFAEVLTYYNLADVFVLPCVAAKNGGRDICPNALIEAMAMKLPVISTTVPAIPEIVDDGASGLLVPPNDASALTDAVARLAGEPSLRRRLGEHGRRKVERQFNLAHNIKQFRRALGAASALSSFSSTNI